MVRTGVATDGYDGDIRVGVGVRGRCGPMGNAASGAPGGPVHRVLRSARVRKDRSGIRQDTLGSWIDTHTHQHVAKMLSKCYQNPFPGFPPWVPPWVPFLGSPWVPPPEFTQLGSPLGSLAPGFHLWVAPHGLRPHELTGQWRVSHSDEGGDWACKRPNSQYPSSSCGTRY